MQEKKKKTTNKAVYPLEELILKYQISGFS